MRGCRSKSTSHRSVLPTNALASVRPAPACLGKQRRPTRARIAQCRSSSATLPPTCSDGNVRPMHIITGPSAWVAADYQHSDEWIYRLTPEDLSEIDAALSHVERLGLDIQDITTDNFNLPSLGPKLRQLQQEVVTGRGFALLRGLPVQQYGLERSATAYWGMGATWGHAVPQNKQGHLLGHVRDIGMDPSNPNHRVYATSAAQPYHTDSCDLVGLLCLATAKEGGLSSWCSSVSLHNAMLQQAPELVQVLTQPFYVDRKGEIPEGKQDYYQMPVFHYHADLLSVIYARGFIQAAQRHPEVPRLTPAQLAALDLVDQLADCPELAVRFQLEAGDIQLLHNHQILHARSAFVDWEEEGRRRHLLRLWLAPDNGRALPDVFAERYGSTVPGSRGGIRCPGASVYVQLEATA